MTFLNSEDLNRQVSVLKAEMAAYGIGGGLHRESATILDSCDQKLRDLESMTAASPVAVAGLSSPLPPVTQQPVLSPARIDLAVPPKQYSYSELDDIRRLQELRDESEARIKKAENDILRAEQEILQSRTEQAISAELHTRVAEEEALRTAVNLVREASPSPLFNTIRSPSITSPVPPQLPATAPVVSPVGYSHTHNLYQMTPIPQAIPQPVPVPVPMNGLFTPVVTTSPVALPVPATVATPPPVAVPILPAPINEVSPYRSQQTTVTGPSEIEVNKRVQELLTRAKLKMTCGIDLPAKSVISTLNPSTMCQPTAGYKQPLSPSRLQRPLSESIVARSEEERMRDYKAGEGLLEVLRRNRGADEGAANANSNTKKEEITRDTSEPAPTHADEKEAEEVTKEEPEAEPETDAVPEPEPEAEHQQEPESEPQEQQQEPQAAASEDPAEEEQPQVEQEEEQQGDALETEPSAVEQQSQPVPEDVPSQAASSVVESEAASEREEEPLLDGIDPFKDVDVM